MLESRPRVGSHPPVQGFVLECEGREAFWPRSEALISATEQRCRFQCWTRLEALAGGRPDPAAFHAWLKGQARRHGREDWHPGRDAAAEVLVTLT
jgi:hypothetical protein